jgi:uncharacterized membrane protein
MIKFTLAARAAHFPLCLLLCTAPASAFETYKVIGVGAGDTLTVRDEPADGGKPSEWKELGSIPADAKNVLGTGRSKLVGEQRWFEVAVGATHGWVNSKFLESADDIADLKDETFNCFGSEPFWGLTLGPKDGNYEDPETKSALTTDRVQAATARKFPLLYRMTDAKGQKLMATVSRQTWCSDGMSDYDHAFQVLLSRDVEFMEGCCVLKR